MKNIVLKQPGGLGDWVRLWRLYMTAFPASERKPFGMIVKMWKAGKTDIWCVTETGSIRGLAITINSPDLVLLDYFAVEKNCRGMGIGHGALAAILDHYRDRGVFLEIEDPEIDGPDQELRQRRKRFYASCGLRDLGTKALLFGVPMELLGVRCSMTFENYQAFFREHYDPWVAKHIEKPAP